MHRNVKFQSQGLNCAGWLFVPEKLPESQNAPALVMAHGLGAVKEQGLEPFCQAVLPSRICHPSLRLPAFWGQ